MSAPAEIPDPLPTGPLHWTALHWMSKSPAHYRHYLDHPVEPTQAPPTATVPPQPTEPPEPTSTEQPGSDLLDTTWILQGYLANLEDDNLTETIPDVTPDMIFSGDGNFNGNTGCNTYSGNYVTDGVNT